MDLGPLNCKGLQRGGGREMEGDTSNPYCSPLEGCQAEHAPEGKAPRSHVENIILAIIHASAFLFSLLCFIYFAFEAVDLFRPRSIVEERLYASPPRSAAERIAGCAGFTIMALPFLAIMAYLLWNWFKMARRWRTESLSNPLAIGADDVEANPRTSDAS